MSAWTTRACDKNGITECLCLKLCSSPCVILHLVTRLKSHRHLFTMHHSILASVFRIVERRMLLKKLDAIESRVLIHNNEFGTVRIYQQRYCYLLSTIATTHCCSVRTLCIELDQHLLLMSMKNENRSWVFKPLTMLFTSFQQRTVPGHSDGMVM